MSDTPQGPGWWLASDGKYYSPETAPPPPPPPHGNGPGEQRAAAGHVAAPASPDGTSQRTGSSRRAKVAAVSLVTVIAVVGAAVLFIDRAESAVAGPRALGVNVTLMDFAGESVTGTFGSCRGTGSYEDFGPGMEIRVLDEDKTIIGSGTTMGREAFSEEYPEYWQIIDAHDPDSRFKSGNSEDKFDEPTDSICGLQALVPLSDDAPYYTVEVGERGETIVNREQLEADGWEVSLDLGET